MGFNPYTFTDGERLTGRFLAAGMRDCSGPVFLFCARNDLELIHAFRLAAESLGVTARAGRAICAGYGPEKLAKSPGRDLLWVGPELRDYLGRYLDACPPGERPLLIWSRRGGNESAPGADGFMKFWRERDVDIWDLETGGPAELGRRRLPEDTGERSPFYG